MSKVIAWPKLFTPTKPPKAIMRPCDYQLHGAIRALEVQLGSVEAYNRLVRAADALKAKIDKGNGRSQNPIYAEGWKG